MNAETAPTDTSRHGYELWEEIGRLKVGQIPSIFRPYLIHFLALLLSFFIHILAILHPYSSHITSIFRPYFLHILVICHSYSYSINLIHFLAVFHPYLRYIWSIYRRYSIHNSLLDDHNVSSARISQHVVLPRFMALSTTIYTSQTRSFQAHASKYTESKVCVPLTHFSSFCFFPKRNAHYFELFINTNIWLWVSEWQKFRQYNVYK